MSAGGAAAVDRDGSRPLPIALTGFMGVGKTSVGLLLAEALERPFYDTDEYVEETTGRSIDSYFPDEEREFRRLEAAAVAELLIRGPSVIALGGGALLDDGSRRLLRERSLLVHLHVPWRELSPHIESLIATRPLLRGRTVADIHRLYQARLGTYRQAALRVTIGRGGTAAAASDVLRALGSVGSTRAGRGAHRGS